MSDRIRSPGLLLPLALLAGCVSAPGGEAPPSATAQPPATAPAGLEGVVGATARALAARFGTPDLDVREGSARKLQFSSAACVLDAYLYPRPSGSEPVVTYVDARLPDGRDIDRASCVAALNARSQAR